MRFHKSSDVDDDTVKTAKSIPFPDFGFLKKQKQSKGEEEEDVEASSSSAFEFPEFLFMVPVPSSLTTSSSKKKTSKKKKSKKCKKHSGTDTDTDTDQVDPEQDAPKRSSFLTVLEKLMGSDNGKEIIAKHANVDTSTSKSKKKKSKKSPHKRSGHPRTIQVDPAIQLDQDRRISDLPVPLEIDVQLQKHTNKKSARMSVSERSATVNMDESRSDFFDWKNFSITSAKSSTNARR